MLESYKMRFWHAQFSPSSLVHVLLFRDRQIAPRRIRSKVLSSSIDDCILENYVK